MDTPFSSMHRLYGGIHRSSHPILHGFLVALVLALQGGCGQEIAGNPRLHPAPSSSRGHPAGEGIREITLGDSRIPVVIIKQSFGREEFVVTRNRAGHAAKKGWHRAEGWRSPADLLFREKPPTSLLYAYPDEAVRPIVLSDSLERSLSVLFLDETGRILALHTVTLAWSRTVLDPGGPARFILFLRPWLTARHGLAAGIRVGIPGCAYHDAEPEYTPITDPPPREIRVGGVPLLVEIADTSEKRMRGLMYRNHIPEGTGMLFVYPEEEVLSYWMLNTRVALDLAYLCQDGRIMKLIRMEPMDLKGKSSVTPVRMALETPAGWFFKHGIKEGALVEIPPEILQSRGKALEQGG